MLFLLCKCRLVQRNYAGLFLLPKTKSKKKCLLVLCESAHVPPPLMHDTSHMTVSFVTFKLYVQKEKNAHELW
jgi:hypothetical protein